MQRGKKIAIGSMLGAALVAGVPATGLGQSNNLPSPYETPAVTAPAVSDDSDTVEAEDAALEAEIAEDADAVAEVDAGAAPPARRAQQGLNLEGSIGFHNIASARPGVRNSYRIGFLGEIYSGSDAIRQNDTNNTLVGNLQVQGTFHEHFSANFRVLAKNSVNSFGQPQAMLSQGDMALGLRGHLAPSRWLDLAADVSFFLPSGFGNTELSMSALSVRPRLLATLDFGEMIGSVNGDKLPLLAHFNVGYLFDNSENLLEDDFTITRVERFAYGINAYDRIEFGVGLEYELPYVTPFAGWSLGVPVNGSDALCRGMRPLECVSDAGFASYPQVLSLGLRGEPVQNLGLQAGVDFGLTTKDAEGLAATLPFNFLVGVSYTIAPVREHIVEERIVEQIVEVAPAQGVLVGVVTDRVTGEAVGGATVEYLTRAENDQLTDAKSGQFRSYGFAPGTVLEVMVRHPAYETQTQTHIVQEGEQELEFKLKALARVGTVRGLVSDMQGNPVAGATIRLNGSQKSELKTDANGRFSTEVPAGSYAVVASAPEYQTWGRDVKIEPNGELAMDMVLRPAAKETLVEVSTEEIKITDYVHFETGAAKILPRSFNVLDQVVAVIFENPQIKNVQIQGHTDDVGSQELNLELSQKRADAVRDYFIEKGVAPERLTARGFGSQQPLLPNTSSRNRSLNRRVEFKIVE